MAKQYDVHEHIRAVSAAAENCRGLVAGLGAAVFGSECVLKSGWAKEGVLREPLKNIMQTFCVIDLIQALPADREERESSLAHLTKAALALDDKCDPCHDLFANQYASFDIVTSQFYGAYANAVGSMGGTRKTSETNELIDPLVRKGIERLNDGETYALIFPGLVQTLTMNRDARLSRP